MSELSEAQFDKQFPGSPTIHCHLQKPTNKSGITVLFGPSGCGKTTTLRCLAGLDLPTAGFIRFDGATWFDGNRGIRLRPQSRGVGFLFQEYAYFPHLTVADNISYGLRNAAAGPRESRLAAMLQIEGLKSLSVPARAVSNSVWPARTLAVRPRLCCSMSRSRPWMNEPRGHSAESALAGIAGHPGHPGHA